MKRRVRLFASVATVWVMGCGDDASTPSTEGVLAATNESGTSVPEDLRPTRITRVETAGATIDFIRVFASRTIATTGGDEEVHEPSFIVASQIPSGGPDPVAEVYSSANEPITNAELYLGLVGPDEADTLPTDLAVHHFQETADLGRSSADFLPTFRKPLDIVNVAALPVLDQPTGLEAPIDSMIAEDAATPGNLGTLQQAVISSGTTSTIAVAASAAVTAQFTAAVPGRIWNDVRLGQTRMSCQTATADCPIQPRPTVLWGCSNRSSFNKIGFYALPNAASSCSANKRTGWIRVGMVWNYPGSTSDQYTIQGYYGSGASWTQLPAEVAPKDTLYIWDWNDPSQHSLAFAFAGVPDFNLRPTFMSGNSVPQ